MGAIAGSLVADARDGVWSERAQASTEHAEDLLRGRPTPIDLAATEAAPISVGLSVGASPLLMDPAAVELIDHVRAWLDAPCEPTFGDPLLQEAARISASSDRYATALEAASDDPSLAVLVGTLHGLHGGIGAVPARAISSLRCPEGRVARRYAARLVDRMLGLHRTDWYDARTRRGPREVLPGLWLSNIHGLSSFTVDHPDGLVLSLCDIEGRLDHHEHQVTFHIDDTPRPDANPSLATVLDEVLDEIAAARAEARPVLVHCRHGASRTGLVLRAVVMREQGIDAEAALVEAECLWPHTSSWNATWGRELDRRAAAQLG